MNYYEVLKVSKQASQDEIKKAYRKHVKECHPDRVHNLDEDIQKIAQEKVLKYNEAYHILSNLDSKAEYDKSLLEQEESYKFVEEREKFAREEKKDRQSERETHERSSIVLEAFLRTIEEKIRNQNEAVKWSRGNTKNFNLTLEGHRRIEEYKIYLKVFTQLGEKDLKSVIHQMRSLDIKPAKLWSTRFTTICLVTEDFNNLGMIKEMVKKYNLQQQEPEVKRKKGKSIISIVDMTTRKVFSPFSENFKPLLRNI